MRKVDSFLKECQRIEGIHMSIFFRIRLYVRVILITQFISDPLTQGFKRFHVLQWNLYTERNFD